MTGTAAAGIAADVIRAFALSIAQLGDRRILAVLAKSLGLMLLLCLLPGVAIWAAVRYTFQAGPVTDWISMLLALATLVLSLWLLFRAVAIAVIGLFGDDIVAAVEARHYPGTRPRPVPFAASLAMGARSALRAVAINLLLLPLYLLLLATGIGTPLVFLAVNGWLLGRDLGDMVAVRHLDRAALPAWRKATAGRRFLLGIGNATLFLMPVLNLLAPVLGAAMATHLFHRSRP